MTNAKSNQQRSIFPWRTKPQGIVEFAAMMPYVEGAALLVDAEKGEIFEVTPALTSMSCYDPDELTGTSLRTLFAGIDDIQAPALSNTPAILLRKMQDSLPVALEYKNLAGNRQFGLVFAKPEKAPEGEDSHPLVKVLQALTQMADLTLDENYTQAVQSMAEVATQETAAGQIAVYQADAGSPQLVKIIETGGATIYPEVISSTNLIRLSKPLFWQAGKRMSADIHHAAAEKQLQYVGSAPLGQAGKSFGLIIASGADEPHPNLMSLLDVFSAQMTRYMENTMLVDNLRRDILRKGQSLVTSQVITDNVQEGVLVVSPQMVLRAMNPAAEWMLGYAEWEVKDKTVDNILIGPDSIMPALEAAANGMPSHNIGNVSLHRRSGVSFPARIQTLPVGREGEVSELVVLIADISENEEIKTRTQQLEQRALLGEVTAVFAHEVRNPINNIYSGLQLLSATLPANDPNQENISRLGNDCVRLNHLMESVLNFSRNTQYQFEAVDLQLLLQRIIERWRPRFSKVNVTPFLKVEEGAPKALADPKALEQVFTNLVGNAVEAMSQNGGNLAVRIAPRNVLPNRPQVAITVSDDGPGIPDDIRERIFEPFVTTKTAGTGLGLAITKRIVTAHHGSIQVSSFPGGTTFEVILLGYNGEES